MLRRALAVRMFAELAIAAALVGFAIELTVAMSGPHAEQVDPLFWVGLIALLLLLWDERRLVRRAWPDRSSRPWPTRRNLSSTRPSAGAGVAQLNYRVDGQVGALVDSVAVGGPCDGARFAVSVAPELPPAVFITRGDDAWPGFFRYVLDPSSGVTVYRFDES